MKPNAIDKLKSANIAPENLSKKINLVYMLPDIAEQILLDIKHDLQLAGVYKFEDKAQIEDCLKRCAKVVKNIDKILTYDTAVKYGENCDMMLNLMYQTSQIK